MIMSEQQIQRGQQWLETLLRLAKFPTAVKAELQAANNSLEEGSCWLTIDETKLNPQQIQALIGPEGAALDAIQYLGNAILNLGALQEEQTAYTIELDGYRSRRQAELYAMAEYAAKQVRETGEEFEMKSLSSAERRQVHTFFQESEDLETYSRGQEPERHLVVKIRS